MFTILSKFVALLIYPLGLAVVLLILGIVALLLRKNTAGTAFCICACIVLYLFSTGPVSSPLVRSLEKQYLPATEFPAASAIVLLTGGEVAKAPPRLFDEVNGGGDRILYAARLAKAYVAPRLIITGGNIDFLRKIEGSQAEASYRLCTGLLGVDSSMILLERRARTTWENGLNTRRLMDSLGLPPKVILVTSAMHMPRSAAIFKKLGFTVYPAPTDYTADLPARFRTMGLFPSVNTLDNSTGALHEYYGMFTYRLLGRL